MIRISRLVVLVLLAMPLAVLAEEPANKGAQEAMHRFVTAQMEKGTYFYFDPVEARLLALRFSKIHEGVRREGSFFVSCSHFSDQFGRSVDLDFLVMPKGTGFLTTQAVVHDIDGKSRPYDLKLKAAK